MKLPLSRLFVSVAVLIGWVTALWASPLSAAPLADDVTVTVDPTTSSVVLGENLDLTVTVTNDGTDATPPLVVHLDITNPDQSTSVDPEDWAPTLNQTVGAIGPGEAVAVNWNIQPISPGTFAAYAVALAPGVDTIASSNVLEVQVADQRSLNPGSILPVAIAAPAFVGALLLLQTRLAKRTLQRPRTRPPRTTVSLAPTDLDNRAHHTPPD